MERPPSQLENVKPSGLKLPSRLPNMSSMPSNIGRALQENSQSDINAKTATAMLPPPSGSLKHKIAGLPEPQAKRKTLAERAGEPINPLRSHMPQPSKAGLARSTDALARPGPNMGVLNTNVYRSTSNTSTASTTSTGSMRPASRLNGSRFGAGRPPSVVDSSNGVEEADPEAGVMGKRKGTPILSFQPLNGISLRKTRTQQDLHDQRSANMSSKIQHSGSCTPNSLADGNDPVASVQQATRSTMSLSNPSQKEAINGQQSRAASLANAFAELSLTPKHRKTSGPKSSTKHHPSLSPVKETHSPSKIPKFSCTPSLRHAQSSQALFSTPSPLKQKCSMNGLRTPTTSTARRGAVKENIPVFLTKEKLTAFPAWDTKGRLEDMEQMYIQLRSQFASAADSKTALEETLSLYKSQVQDLSKQNRELQSLNRDLSSDLERARNDLHATTTDLTQARRDHEREVHDAERKHEKRLDELYSNQEKESRKLERELEKIMENSEKEIQDAKKAWEKQKDQETADLTTQHWEELEELRGEHLREVQKLQAQIEEWQKSSESRATESATEVQGLRDSNVGLQSQIEAANATANALRSQVSATESKNATLEQEKAALVSKAHFLEGNQEAQSQEFTSMRDQLQAAIDEKIAALEKLRKEEMVRRRLNATILELRGNIRVFARTRPMLAGEEEPSKVEYPDLHELDGKKELVVHGPKQLTATGKERIEKHNYAFDRVFGPDTANRQVFDDCSDLIQSVVDGYNVSILSYGQTGSGKTFGMSGPEGIIPSSITFLLSEMQRLREKGWEYIVEASFVEVYNETLNDLLGDAKTWDDTGSEDLNASVRGKKRERHEIHHDSVTGKTTVTSLSAVKLWPPPENDASWPPSAPAASDVDDGPSYTEQAVSRLLDTAAKNRRVAATKSNERSSRSHSVFILNLRGSCAVTGESSEGVLNLVDLAGSERLKQSGAEGNRMKETQAINKSLSALGDVIAALGNKKGDESHVPYRNSKLTYLLQSSLGGTMANGKSSRTLMLLHLSPLQAHWQESRGSLLFGSKVHGTHIGAAKKK